MSCINNDYYNPNAYLLHTLLQLYYLSAILSSNLQSFKQNESKWRHCLNNAELYHWLMI